MLGEAETLHMAIFKNTSTYSSQKQSQKKSIISEHKSVVKSQNVSCRKKFHKKHHKSLTVITYSSPQFQK